MNKRNKIDLNLLIADFDDIAPDEITELLQIQPVHKYIKGQRKNPHNPQSPLWNGNGWRMASGLDSYATFEDQMNAILDIIEAKYDRFEKLCSQYYCEFSCAIFTYSNNEESTPWIHLGKRYHRIASALNIEFDIDLYAW